MLYKVKLELARSREFPQGNSECGYELVLPLTEDRGLDLQAWRQRRDGNSARRYWRNDGEARGELKRDREGWFLAFGYGVARDEAIFRGDDLRFAIGEQISIIEFDGQTRVFRVLEAEPLGVPKEGHEPPGELVVATRENAAPAGPSVGRLASAKAVTVVRRARKPQARRPSRSPSAEKSSAPCAGR